MKIYLKLTFILTIFVLISCSQKPNTQKLKSEELDKLTLIEFASKLEEDYYRLHPSEKQSP